MAGDHAYSAGGLAIPESLEQLHTLIERVGAEQAHVPASDLSMVETAVIEIAGNLVAHGRPPGQVLYRFTLEVHPDRLRGVLADSGEPLPPDLQVAAADELADSGRGLFIAHAVLDELTYEQGRDGNTWTMVRILRS